MLAEKGEIPFKRSKTIQKKYGDVPPQGSHRENYMRIMDIL